MSVNQQPVWTSPRVMLTSLLCLAIGGLLGGFITSKVMQKQHIDTSGESAVSDVARTNDDQTPKAENRWGSSMPSPFAVTSNEAENSSEHTNQSAFKDQTPGIFRNKSSGTPAGLEGIKEGINAPTTSDFRELTSILQSIDDADLESIQAIIGKSTKTYSPHPASSIVNRALFQRMAELSPEAVMQWLDKRVNKVNPWQNESIILDALAGLTTHNARDAEQWLAGHKGSEHHSWLVHTLYQTQSIEDPALLLDDLVNNNDEDGVAYSVLGNWGQQDPAAAFEWIEQNWSNPMIMGMASSVIESWLQVDPDAALAGIEAFPDQQSKVYMLSRYASTIAQDDPQGAYDWILSQSDEQLRTLATMEIIPMWADNDISGLIQMIESETDPIRQQELYGAASHQLVYVKGQDNPEEAVRWAESLPEMTRMTTLPVAFDTWMYQSPKEAIAWLGTQSDSPTTRAMQNSAMWVMPQHDLDSALATFQNVSRDIREASVSMIVSELSKQRPAELDSFVNSIDHPDVRRIAETARENLTVVANADAHFAELDSLTGEARIEKMWTLFQALSTHDPERIERWMAENPLSAIEQRAMEQYAMTQLNTNYTGGMMNPPPMFDHYRQYGVDY